MRRKTLVTLAVAGVLAGAVFVIAGSPPEDEFTSEGGGAPLSLLHTSGPAYVVEGTYLGPADVQELEDHVAILLEVKDLEFLGDDSPGIAGQKPPPTLQIGEKLPVYMSTFDVDKELSSGDSVIAMLSHNSNFDPGWSTSTIAVLGDQGIATVGSNADAIEPELLAAAGALAVSPEEAFLILAREMFSADAATREGAKREDTFGPALRAVAADRQATMDAASPEVAWEAADPTERGLQRGVAPDAVLDSLMEMSVVYTISGDFIRAYPDALIQVRNDLGITSSIAANLAGASDAIFGDPDSSFEVTIRISGDKAPATVVASLHPTQWKDQHALMVEVDVSHDGTAVAHVAAITLEQFRAAIGG